MESEATMVAKYSAVAPVLDERSRRQWAAAESAAIGYGGDALLSSATGLARETIRKGHREIARDEPPTSRIRAPGALTRDRDGRISLSVFLQPGRRANDKRVRRGSDRQLLDALSGRALSNSDRSSEAAPQTDEASRPRRCLRVNRTPAAAPSAA